MACDRALAKRESLVPLGRIGRAGDIGAAVAFLASAGASCITGPNLLVDGGISDHMLTMTPGRPGKPPVGQLARSPKQTPLVSWLVAAPRQPVFTARRKTFRPLQSQRPLPTNPPGNQAVSGGSGASSPSSRFMFSSILSR